MNKSFIPLAILALVLPAITARATLYSYDFNSGFADGGVVADGNLAGWTDSHTISDAGSGTIVDVSVTLNMSGGYAGDMYGYLVLTDSSTHSTLGFSVLLNRVGTGSGSEPQFSFGYQDTGLNITLSDTGANGNIHNYQNVAGYPSLTANGGAFQTDGGSLANFAGQNANNTWTLFLADESTGGVMQVNDWGLSIEVIPEPVTWAVLIFGMAMAGVLVLRRRVGIF
jgi:hypothetical protein